MIYLAYLDGRDLGPGTEGPWREVRVLRPGLVLIESDQHRSAVYHALKDHLPGGSPLLVAELDEVPKFKGMAEGALAWARTRLPRRSDRDAGGRPSEARPVAGQRQHAVEGDP